MASVNMDTMIVRNSKDFLANTIGEEIVVMDMKEGSYIGLNPVGAHIWKLLEQPVTMNTIVTTLMQEYNIDEGTCREQTLAYVEKMLEKGMAQQVS